MQNNFQVAKDPPTTLAKKVVRSYLYEKFLWSDSTYEEAPRPPWTPVAYLSQPGTIFSLDTEFT